MIKNNAQYKRTQVRLAEMTAQLESLLAEVQGQRTARQEFAIASFEALIDDMAGEITEYETLCGGGLHIVQPKSLEELPKALIQARIARGLTQKKFAELLSLREQQVQRYESEEYTGISFDRLLEFVAVLKLKFHIEKTMISCERTNLFDFGGSLTAQIVETESQKVKERRSLLMA